MLKSLYRISFALAIIGLPISFYFAYEHEYASAATTAIASMGLSINALTIQTEYIRRRIHDETSS